MWIAQTHRYLDSFDVAEVVEKALSLPEEAWHQDEALYQQLTANRPTNSVFVQSISADAFAEIMEAGSSPSTVTAWDFRAAAKIKSVNISMDIRNAIHGLEIWQE